VTSVRRGFFAPALMCFYLLKRKGAWDTAVSLYGGHTVVPRLSRRITRNIPTSNALERGAGPETKIHIDAIPGDGGRVRWDGDERKTPAPSPRTPVPLFLTVPRQEQRACRPKPKSRPNARFFDNERTNPISA